MSIHLVLLTASVCSLAAAAAGRPLGGLTTDLRRARQMAILTSTALVVGNAACLLPGTPAWYSAALVALTFGGLVWMVISQVTARRTGTSSVVHTRTDRRSQVSASYGGSALAGQARAPHLRVVSTTTGGPAAADTTEGPSVRPHLAVLAGGRPAQSQDLPVVEATYVPSYDWDEDVDWDDRRGSYAEQRAVVTRRELDTIGPRFTRSQSVSVARDIRALAPEAGRRRAAGSAFAARGHARGGAVLRTQLEAAYNDAPERARRHGTQA